MLFYGVQLHPIEQPSLAIQALQSPLEALCCHSDDCSGMSMVGARAKTLLFYAVWNLLVQKVLSQQASCLVSLIKLLRVFFRTCQTADMLTAEFLTIL